MSEAWLDTAQLFVSEAHSAFEQLEKTGPADTRREAALGAAVTLLELPPQSHARVEQSAAALRLLYKENSNDSTGLAAGYLLGRIRQVFNPEGQAEPSPPELISLADNHPDSVYGQLAMLKLTLHQLYLPQSDPTPAARLRSLAKYEAKITFPNLQREYHLLIANAQIFFEIQEPEALRHLQSALELGIPNAVMRADVLVQIGEIARALGQDRVAEISYRRFLEENVHDERIMMVRDRLTELETAHAPTL